MITKENERDENRNKFHYSAINHNINWLLGFCQQQPIFLNGPPKYFNVSNMTPLKIQMKMIAA